MSYSAIKEIAQSKSSLVSRNITVLGRRTSVRLEPEMWKALKDISVREDCTTHDLCSLICVRKNPNTSLTAAIRVFLMLYYRAATTEDGHQKAGHGNFESMKRRAGMKVNPQAAKPLQGSDNVANRHLYVPAGADVDEPKRVASAS